MTTSTTAYLSDGRHVDVPDHAVRAWRYDVRNGDTTSGLADWYTDGGDENQDEIQGSADPGTSCDHEELSHRIVNESQIGDYDKDRPMRMARVCHRRACILDAMAWVERGTGEPAAWAAPNLDYRFDVPKEIVGPLPVVTAAPSQGSRLTAVMADHDRGPEYALAQCTGAGFTCVNEARIENSKSLTDDEITGRLKERGWSVSPTLCPAHNITEGQVPLPVAV